MSLFDWQSAESVERIQNTNYVADFVDDYYKQYNAYKGLVLTQNTYDQGLYLLKSLDSAVRIPGILTNSDIFVGIGDISNKLSNHRKFLSFAILLKYEFFSKIKTTKSKIQL